MITSPSRSRSRVERAPFLLVLATMLTVTGSASAKAPEPNLNASSGSTDAVELMDMSLEELMEMDVSVVSRSKRAFSQLPAAVYVLTGDEIRRSGHSSVQEALRMVPGFYVSRWNTNSWDVTARGYGTGLSQASLAYNNQLLVMIDGVVVYTPLFAGVWWPLQDLDLNDIDRIEIVRGPAGVLWGSNAVQGIVHIITRTASDTQGFRAFARSGTDDRHYSARFGLPAGENGFLRAWGKFAEYDPLHNLFLDIESNWELGSGGFRGDWTTDSGKQVTFWGRGYDGNFHEIGFDLTTFDPLRVRSDKDGYMALASIEDPESNSRWQAWYSIDRQDLVTLMDLRIETIDLEYQKIVPISDTNSLTMGVGYRVIDSSLQGDDPFFLDFDPQRVTQKNWRAYLVDHVQFASGRAEVDFGFQIEHNEFTGMQVQPTLRGSWKANEELTFWGGLTRAVRTPSLEEVTSSINSFVVGNPDFRAEEVLATEIGMRKRFSDKAVVDVALFHNDYDHMSLARPLPPFGQFELVNGADGVAYGGEVAIDLWPSERWQLRSAYSFLYDDFDRAATGQDLVTGDYSPKHVINVRSYYDLTDDLELDAGLYVVEGLNDPFDEGDYVRGDVRLGWRINDEIRMSFGVQDFANSTRSEFDDFDNVRRSFYVTLTVEPKPDGTADPGAVARR